MKSARKQLSVSLLVLAAVIFSNSSISAVDMFLDIPGVTGESQDEARKDQIDVLAWSWGASNSLQGKNGFCRIQDIGITKWVDRSSPDLLMANLTGLTYDSATLVVRRAGLEPLEYITVELTDVRVTSVSTGGSGGEDRLTENISLNFSSGKFVYIPQDINGKPLAPVEAVIDGC